MSDSVFDALERLGNSTYQPGQRAHHPLDPTYADGQLADFQARYEQEDEHYRGHRDAEAYGYEGPLTQALASEPMNLDFFGLSLLS